MTPKTKIPLPTHAERIVEISKFKERVEYICHRCKRTIYNEEAFVTTRWSCGMHRLDYRFCKDCCPNAESVLNLVDTDEVLYGLANTDSYIDFHKKSDAENERFKYELLKGLIPN